MSGEEREVGVVRVSGVWGQGIRVTGLFVYRQGQVRARVRLDGLVSEEKGDLRDIILMPTLDHDILQHKCPNDKPKIVLESTNQGLERGIGA